MIPRAGTWKYPDGQRAGHRDKHLATLVKGLERASGGDKGFSLVFYNKMHLGIVGYIFPQHNAWTALTTLFSGFVCTCICKET